MKPLLVACVAASLAACSQEPAEENAADSMAAPEAEIGAAAPAMTDQAPSTEETAETTAAAEAMQAAATEAAPTEPFVMPDVPAGDYTLDKAHASLIFRVSHLGFSNYTARFKTFDANLYFDPQAPEQSRLTATVDTSSLETDFPMPEMIDFNAELTGPKWLDAGQFPEMTYTSTNIEITGANTARVTGDFNMHGVTHPVELDITFNGGWPGMEFDPHARVGFSARGKLNRSDFGLSMGIPAPGSNLGVSDAVEIIIETEFTGPALADPDAPPAEEIAPAEEPEAAE